MLRLLLRQNDGIVPGANLRKALAGLLMSLAVSGCSTMSPGASGPHMSIEEIGALQSRIAFDETRADSVLREKGLTPEEWEQIHAKTVEEVSSDRTGNDYRRYLRGAFAASEGRYGEYGRSLARSMESGRPLRDQPPISMARWVELRDSMEVARWSGQNPGDILKVNNLTAYEWFLISSWWHQRMTDASRSGEQALVQEYAAIARSSRERATERPDMSRAQLGNGFSPPAATAVK